MKKYIYIFAFVFLGILLQSLVHAVMELMMIDFLTKDFARFSLGFSWNAWFLIHYIGTIVLFFIGAAFGLQQGFYWWRKIYVEHCWGKK